MEERAGNSAGCAAAALWLAGGSTWVGALLLGTFALAGPSSFGLNALCATLAALVGMGLGLGAVIAFAIARVPRSPGWARPVATALGTVAAVAIVGATIWFTVGPPATGTLTEVVALAVGPPLVGVAALLVAPPGARLAAAALCAGSIATALLIIVVARPIAA
jgi:hypothetical protein